MAAGARPAAPIESASSAMRPVLEVLSRVAAHDVPVLLRGESGSGKSALARSLHAASPRRERPLVPVDCRELAAEALRSGRSLAARIEEALGSTLLLEEVGALPERLQAGLLSLLEPSGAGRAAPVRVVATSERRLEDAVAAGEFRGDLLRRLAVVEVRVPPLRARREDVLPLARAFLGASGLRRGEGPPALSPRAERALLAYPWPGNLRELRNAVERALVLEPGPVVDLEGLPPRIAALGGDP